MAITVARGRRTLLGAVVAARRSATWHNGKPSPKGAGFFVGAFDLTDQPAFEDNRYGMPVIIGSDSTSQSRGSRWMATRSSRIGIRRDRRSRRSLARQAYLDGELCGIRPDGTTSFSLIQNASDTGNGNALVFFLFDLLHLDGEAVSPRPLKERKDRLRALLSLAGSPLQLSDHQIGRGPAFHEHVCGLKLEGIISKQADAPYTPGNRGLWLKVKCLNREEFVVVGWTDPC
jgi:hypothetical protein